MLETKEQKQIFVGSIILIVILIVVSIVKTPTFLLDDTKKPMDGQALLNSKLYLDYWQALNIDQEASKELMQTILTKEEIKKEIENVLDIKQKIIPPRLAENRIKTVASNSESMNEYLSKSLSEAHNFNKSNEEHLENFFSGNAGGPDSLKARLVNFTNKLYDLPVPKDAVETHKALITGYLSYLDLVNVSKSYVPLDENRNSAVWPQFYKSMIVANEANKTYAQELSSLASKYKITSVDLNSYAQNDKKDFSEYFIPKAHALFGFGDLVIVVENIPEAIWKAIQAGFKRAFVRFLGDMLNKFITKIEKNYAISNFLYYSDALASGQYAEDYLNKYVNDPLDKNIVRKLLPQFNCGQNPDLRQVFQSKAQQYLGFDPRSVSLNDPDYYAKMARVGDFMSSPSGQQSFFQDLASQTENVALRSVQQELTSSGLKTPRDFNSTIIGSLNSIASAEAAAFDSIFKLGIQNADDIAGSIAGALTESLVNKFIFGAITGEDGNITVFKEQTTCVSASVINPVLPIPPTQYTNPSAPTEQAAVAQECSYYGNLNDDCTNAIMGELAICAINPSQHTGSLTCLELAKSPYPQKLWENCQPNPNLSILCRNLQSHLSKIK